MIFTVDYLSSIDHINLLSIWSSDDTYLRLNSIWYFLICLDDNCPISSNSRRHHNVCTHIFRPIEYQPSQVPQPTLRSDFQVSWRIWLAEHILHKIIWVKQSNGNILLNTNNTIYWRPYLFTIMPYENTSHQIWQQFSWIVLQSFCIKAKMVGLHVDFCVNNLNRVS